MRQYDVVVIGGGIHGVGVAQAAAAAGHSALLLEKKALAAGTSGRSSKLIHGGLRYLETGQFRLVREGLEERRILLRIAPDLVELKPFFLPLYRTSRRKVWQLRAGLALYAALGGLRPDCRFESVPRRNWTRLDDLETAGLLKVFRYFDAQTDDALLTRAVMESARSLGAELAMPAEFLNAQVRDDEVIARYAAPEREIECSAQALVNAAGPWIDSVARRISPSPAPRAVDLIQGTHILLPDPLQQGIYYVENPRDGRAVFVMPRGANTLLGTTESVFHGSPDEVAPLSWETDYLLTVLRHYFPRYQDFDAAGVLESWAGLRVLPAGKEAAFRRSRETILDVDNRRRPRVLSIYGGKLTTYRATAGRVLARLSPSLPGRTARADTARLLLRVP